MKKLTIMLVFLILVTISAKPAKLVAEDVVEKPKTNKEIVENLVEKYSKEYHVSSKSMMKTLSNENDTFDFDRQSELKYKKNNRWKQPAGSKEKSYGVAMIHLPDHPEITKEEAIDPDFAVEYMAKEFAKGNQSKWMGYKK